MDEKAEHYTKRGLQLVHAGRLQEALELFNKAISVDPYNARAYHNRGETYLMLGRIVEGNTDIQKAKDLRSGKIRNRKREKTARLNLDDVDSSIYDSVFPDGEAENDNAPLRFDDTLYDYVFSDDEIRSEETWEGISRPPDKQSSFPAILEFIGGKRIEVPAAILFQPTENDISLLRKDGYVERVIPLEQFACIRIAGLPDELACERDENCHVEIIETVDGNIYHESVPPKQDHGKLLLGFSTKEETRFQYSCIPHVNIRKRCQQRYLGEILMEKRFITGDILKKALEEHQQNKTIKLGRIIAQKAKILYADVEKELEKAKKGKVQGLKTGEILLASGLVNEEQVLDALEYQEALQTMKIGQFLIEKGIVQEKEVYLALSEKFRIPFVDLRTQKVSRKVLALFPRRLVLDNEILPITVDGDRLTVATHLPEPEYLCEEILKEYKCSDIRFVLAQPTHIRNIINLLYRKIGLGR
ncbi:MAG: hypothetical protein Kow0089_15330 [Desulfobulbaceae bacterium]